MLTNAFIEACKPVYESVPPESAWQLTTRARHAWMQTAEAMQHNEARQQNREY